MNKQDWHIGVLIPARNEEALLPRCLKSVLAARSRLPADVTCDIVVAVDSSTDRTLRIAKKMVRGRGTVVSTDAGLVGGARALAARVMLARYRGPLDRCWLANTDADCRVPPTWLKEQLTLASDDIEAIAGTVAVDSFVEHTFGVERFEKSYLIYPDGSHPHVHGANLGVRADAYLKTGGWGELGTAEDHDLWERLLHIGANRISVGSMKVVTSGRRVGRAPFGFADALSAHNAAAV
jgi:glycosyltransferase involved in cell wall biosynthesis